MRVRTALVAAPLFAVTVAGCSGDPASARGGLTPDDVAGVYSVCTLAFAPAGSVLPAIDIRAAVMDTAPAAPLPSPNLKVARQTTTFELEYTPRQDFVPTRLSGRYTLGSATMSLSFVGPHEALARAALLPGAVVVRVDKQTRNLTIGAEQPRYFVARADYARMAGVAETNLPAQVEGTLTGRIAAACD